MYNSLKFLKQFIWFVEIAYHKICAAPLKLALSNMRPCE
ncbi:hypothetical protein VIBNIAM115_640012 [Vibrio nigripulchritudo AM115]|nr:hypothetical protein VIBNIAM115_640012 [Vibrio nigripulchritudo AM115]